MKPSSIVLSPGPCDPDKAGICLELIKMAAGRVPILGVCLGHQAIGQAYGGKIVRAPKPMHGKLSIIHHNNKSVFKGLENDFSATRYHSLTVDPGSLPACLDVTAETEGGVIMGLAHKTHPVHGVQFHPESIASAAWPRAVEELSRSCTRFANGACMKKTDDFGAALKRVAAGHPLNEEETTRVFTAMMKGEVSHTRMAAFLTALSMRHASVDEIIGGARVMRETVIGVQAPPGAIDVCGTGGDGQGTLNVSTAAAFVVAGSGVPVAKHGNRAMSSRAGSADVLEALGVHIGLEEGGAEACLRAARICFMFAQAHHPSMKHVAAVRQELGFRTIFNLLGPLTNPAHVKRQLIGVYDESWLEPFAHALKVLGAEKAWIVHGQGMDELALSGVTKVAALEHGDVRTFEISPEDAGFARAPLKAIKGGTAEKNAEAIRALLRGARGPFRDIVVLNAAAALIVADKVPDLHHGVQLASAAIDEGAAQAALDTLIAASREVAA